MLGCTNKFFTGNVLTITSCSKDAAPEQETSEKSSPAIQSVLLLYMNIRKIEISDIKQLQEVAQETFSETFSSMNRKENMEKYLAENLSIEALAAELNNEHSEFYFAETGDKIIGYLKINFGTAQTEEQNNNALEIERIYVLKEFHGKKVGQLLYQKAMDIAVQKNVKYVWLGVWEKNMRAVGFYKKNGFVEFDKHIFKLGDDEQTDLMMKLDLNNPSIEN